MADRRDSSADSDKIKQLLAQLRAKFDMEENAGKEETQEPLTQAFSPDEDDAPTVSFPIARDGDGAEEGEKEEVYPIRKISRTFGTSEWGEEESDDWHYIDPEDDGSGENTGYGSGEYGEAELPRNGFADYDADGVIPPLFAPEETDSPSPQPPIAGKNAASEPPFTEKPDPAPATALPEPPASPAWEDKTVPFAHTPAGLSPATSEETVEISHADGERCGDETLAFFLDRYAIAPKRGEKVAREPAQTPPEARVAPFPPEAEKETTNEKRNVAPYRVAPEKTDVPPVPPMDRQAFAPEKTASSTASTGKKPQANASDLSEQSRPQASPSFSRSAYAPAGTAPAYEPQKESDRPDAFDFSKPPVQVDFAPADSTPAATEADAYTARGDESPVDYRDAPTDYGIAPNPSPVRPDHEESGHTVAFPFLRREEKNSISSGSPAEGSRVPERSAPPTEPEVTPAPVMSVPPEIPKTPEIPEIPEIPEAPASNEMPAARTAPETPKPQEKSIPPVSTPEKPEESAKRQEMPPQSPEPSAGSESAGKPDFSKKPQPDEKSEASGNPVPSAKQGEAKPPVPPARKRKEEWTEDAGQRGKRKQPGKRRAVSDVEYNSRVQTEKVRRRLLFNIQTARTRLIFAAMMAFVLLWLENAQAVGLPIPLFLTDVAVLTAVNAGVLLLCALLCCRELIGGFHSLTTGGPTPASLVLVSLVCTLLYTGGAALYRFAVGGTEDIPLFSFVAALGCVLLLSFEAVKRESRYASFRVLAQSGDKLIFSLAPPKDAQVESNVLGKKIGVDIPYIYRVRKTGFVDEFASRTAQNCEDYRLNLWLLFASLLLSLTAGAVGAIVGRGVWDCLGGALLALLLTLPFCMCASHIFPVSRMISVAGEDSTVLGEKSARECATLDAVEFEDIEAISSHNVRVRHIKMYAGNLDRVLYYVSSLFHLVGGPLRGYFGRSTKELGYSSDAVLTEAVPGGLCATVDRAHVLLGDGDYMQKNGVKLYFDPEDAHQIESGKVCIMYAAVNHKVCAKFYVQYMVSPAFERNVKRLSRHGIATIIRTYDPNISNRLLLRISAISDYRVHVVTKTVEQRKDFAAPHLTGGLVTAADSGKLLRLLFLCLKTRGVITWEGVLKTASVCFGGLLLTAALIFGWYRLPSALFGMYHLVWLGLALLWACFGIRKEKEKKKKNEKKEKGKPGKK